MDYVVSVKTKLLLRSFKKLSQRFRFYSKYNVSTYKNYNNGLILIRDFLFTTLFI